MKHKFDKIGLATGFTALIAASVAIGVFCRLVNLDRKPYWSDEVHTSVLVSGYRFTEQQQLQTGAVIGIADLHRFQQPDPNQSIATSVSRTVENLAFEDNRHTPLYYSILTVWQKWLGHSVTITRSLSVLLSLLAFPCLYWLCQELFASPRISWLAIALVAVSPVHVLYAQEARPYSLWGVTILVASAALLRAMRVATAASWLCYSITVVLGLYTHVLFVLVAAGHGLYVAGMQGWRWRKPLLAYGLASLAALVCFLPWALVILFIQPRFDAQSEWQLDRQSVLTAAARWVGILSRGFLDFNIGPDAGLNQILPLIPLILWILAIACYALYFLYRQTPQRTWWFVWTLVGATGCALMLPDLILGQQRGTTRFIFPCILGLQLAIAYLLARQITAPRMQQQRIWQGITAIVLLIGVASCGQIASAPIWWNKKPSENQHQAQVAALINQFERPLVISDAFVKRVQTLSYALEPKVKYQLVQNAIVPQVAPGFSHVFLFEPSEELRSALEDKYQLRAEQLPGKVWKLPALS